MSTIDPTAADLLRRARLPGCAAILDRDPGAALMVFELVVDLVKRNLSPGECYDQRLVDAGHALWPLARAAWDARAGKGESGEQMGARP